MQLHIYRFMDSLPRRCIHNKHSELRLFLPLVFLQSSGLVGLRGDTRLYIQITSQYTEDTSVSLSLYQNLGLDTHQKTPPPALTTTFRRTAKDYSKKNRIKMMRFFDFLHMNRSERCNIQCAMHTVHQSKWKPCIETVKCRDASRC
jgi:hypothetical protein